MPTRAPGTAQTCIGHTFGHSLALAKGTGRGPLRAHIRARASPWPWGGAAKKSAKKMKIRARSHDNYNESAFCAPAQTRTHPCVKHRWSPIMIKCNDIRVVEHTWTKAAKRRHRSLARKAARARRSTELDIQYQQKFWDMVDALNLNRGNVIYGKERLSIVFKVSDLADKGITKATLNKPDQLYMITRSVMDRRHWLDERDRNAVALFKFVLALACERFAMRAVKIVFMRNHIHMLVHDKEGRISQFQRYFFWLTAVKMNRYLGRSGTFWINDGRETV